MVPPLKATSLCGKLSDVGQMEPLGSAEGV